MKKILAIVLSFVLLLSVMPLSVFAATYSGTCGENLTWELDSITGTLTISGNGDMTNYSGKDAPWHSKSSYIKNIEIAETVTSIGNLAFAYCMGLTEVNIPSNVKVIGKSAFWQCENLTKIVIGNGVNSIGVNAFGLCNSLTKVDIPDSVTSIGDGAFSDCRVLKEVSIGSSVNSINGTMFAGSWALEIITMEENEKYHLDGNCVIETETKTLVVGCKNSIIPLDGSVTSIGDYAFYGRRGLTEIYIPDSITSIGRYAFYYCIGLTEITIPDSITSIDWRAFMNCESVTEVVIGSGVTSIDDTAFYSLTNLESITVAEGNSVYHSDGNCLIETQFKSLILGCKNSIIPNSVKRVENAFCYCTNLTEITIPSSVTDIYDRAFFGCTNLKTVNNYSKIYIEKGKTNHGYLGYYADTVNNWSIDMSGKCGDGLEWSFDLSSGGLSITGSGDMTDYTSSSDVPWYPFRSMIKNITLSENLTKIGAYAFYNCGGLTEITIPKSVENIGVRAFYWCEGLTEVDIPDNVTSIGAYAFSNCGGLTEVDIPDNVTDIGNGAFSRCKNLTYIKLGDGVIKVGGQAFSYCTGLTEITIPSSVTDIKSEAFFGCTNLKTVNNYSKIYIEKGVINHGYLGYYADTVNNWSIDMFGECGNGLEWSFDPSSGGLSITGSGDMADYTSPSDVPWSPFRSMIKNITLSENLTKIGAYAFYDCYGLTEVDIPDSVTSIGANAFFYCGSLTEITIPKGVENIGERAFCRCTNLTKITIPNGVTEIGSFTFGSCYSLREITIPNSVKSICLGAFHNSCPKIYYLGTESQWNKIEIERFDEGDLDSRFESDGLDFAKIYYNVLSAPREETENVFVSVPAVEEGTEFVVDKLETNIALENVIDNSILAADEVIVYDMQLQKDNIPVQPTGTATVYVPVPENMKGELCKIYYIDDAGNTTDMNAIFENGLIKFNTDHFSKYAIFESNENVGDLKIAGASLTLYNDISVNFVVNKVLFTGTSYTNPYMEFEFNGKKTTVSDYTEDGDYYKFSFKNIAPDKMSDTIKATLYATLDGELVSGSVKEYKVTDYCDYMLTNYGTEAYSKFRTLLVDLLNYGAETQIYTGYKTDSLVNANLNEEQKSWASADIESFNDALNKDYTTIDNPTVNWSGAWLELNSAITVKLLVATDSTENLSVKITNDAGKEWILDSAAFKAYDESNYQLDFNGLDASQMSDNIYLTVYKDNVAVSNTLRYSVESYAKAMKDSTYKNLAKLVQCMMKYGNSANRYKN